MFEIKEFKKKQNGLEKSQRMAEFFPALDGLPDSSFY